MKKDKNQLRLKIQTKFYSKHAGHFAYSGVVSSLLGSHNISSTRVRGGLVGRAPPLRIRGKTLQRRDR